MFMQTFRVLSPCVSVLCCKSNKAITVRDHNIYLFTPKFILAIAAIFPKNVAKWKRDLFIRSSNMTRMPTSSTSPYNITPSVCEINCFLLKVIPKADAWTTVNAAIWTESRSEVRRQWTVAWNWAVDIKYLAHLGAERPRIVLLLSKEGCDWKCLSIRSAEIIVHPTMIAAGIMLHELSSDCLLTFLSHARNARKRQRRQNTNAS